MDTTPSNARPTEELLALRQKYRRVCNRARSHLKFVTESQTKGTTPRGRRINVRCHAFLKRKTNVEEEFKETTRCAEAEYVENLKEHDTAIVNKLEEDEKTWKKEEKEQITLRMRSITRCW
jgi:hypothetical protein